jgi:hypothetical protein
VWHVLPLISMSTVEIVDLHLWLLCRLFCGTVTGLRTHCHVYILNHDSAGVMGKGQFT